MISHFLGERNSSKDETDGREGGQSASEPPQKETGGRIGGRPASELLPAFLRLPPAEGNIRKGGRSASEPALTDSELSEFEMGRSDPPTRSSFDDSDIGSHLKKSGWGSTHRNTGHFLGAS